MKDINEASAQPVVTGWIAGLSDPLLTERATYGSVLDAPNEHTVSISLDGGRALTVNRTHVASIPL